MGEEIKKKEELKKKEEIKKKEELKKKDEIKKKEEELWIRDELLKKFITKLQKENSIKDLKIIMEKNIIETKLNLDHEKQKFENYSKKLKDKYNKKEQSIEKLQNNLKEEFKKTTTHAEKNNIFKIIEENENKWKVGNEYLKSFIKKENEKWNTEFLNLKKKAYQNEEILKKNINKLTKYIKIKKTYFEKNNKEIDKIKDEFNENEIKLKDDTKKIKVECNNLLEETSKLNTKNFLLKVLNKYGELVDFKKIIEFLNIKQIYISSSLIHLKERVLRLFSLKEYTNSNESCIFFGIYLKDDISKVNKHLGEKYVMFGGTELNTITQINCKKIISISKNLKERVEKLGYKS